MWLPALSIDTAEINRVFVRTCKGDLNSISVANGRAEAVLGFDPTAHNPNIVMYRYRSFVFVAKFGRTGGFQLGFDGIFCDSISNSPIMTEIINTGIFLLYPFQGFFVKFKMFLAVILVPTCF